jgi:hypothetical protein
MSNKTPPSNEKKAVTNAVKVAGELFIMPGTSLIMEGKVGSGLLHAGAAWVLRAVVWKPLALLAIANSLSKSITGEGILSSNKKEPDARKSTLDDRVRQHVAEGMTMEEIQETVREDVEDLVLESRANGASSAEAEASPDANPNPSAPVSE